MLNKNVLLISNKNTFSVDTLNTLNKLHDSILSNNFRFNFFREDLNLYKLYKDDKRVYAIKTLNTDSDELFLRENEKIYTEDFQCTLKTIKTEDDAYKRSLKRFPAPRRNACFDNIEYKTRRYSTVQNRSKFVISKLFDEFQIIVLLRDKKQYNLINSYTPKYGDGKFIYDYDCTTNLATFNIGGVVVPNELFFSLLGGENCDFNL